jgi:hypothetical protein
LSYEHDAAARYRLHAEELRAIAEGDGLERTRGILMRVAQDYEIMARNMEELEAIHKHLKQS